MPHSTNCIAQSLHNAIQPHFTQLPRNRYTIHISPNNTHFSFTAPYSAFLKFQSFASKNCPIPYILLLNCNIPNSPKTTISATFYLTNPAHHNTNNFQPCHIAFFEISNLNPSII